MTKKDELIALLKKQLFEEFENYNITKYDLEDKENYKEFIGLLCRNEKNIYLIIAYFFANLYQEAIKKLPKDDNKQNKEFKKEKREHSLGIYPN
ncbi:MAG: hypothetical protein ACTSXD_06775 [Candidatus Heimdallarchaeaceae archaeon]